MFVFLGRERGREREREKVRGRSGERKQKKKKTHPPQKKKTRDFNKNIPQWEPSAGKPGLSDLYLKTMDRIAPLCPSCLFFVEGTGQSNARANWGDGFITDEDFIRENGKISSAKPFFDKLVEKPYISQVVLSPHIYCPSSSKASDGFAGAELFERLDRSFGEKTAGKGPKEIRKG